MVKNVFLYKSAVNLASVQPRAVWLRRVICTEVNLPLVSQGHGSRLSYSPKEGTEMNGLRGRGSIPGSGRSPGGGNGNPLWYSCLKNPMDRGAWRATVHEVAKSQTQLSDFTSPGMELLGHTVVRFLAFWEASTLLSTVGTSIYIPTNSVLGSTMFLILTAPCGQWLPLYDDCIGQCRHKTLPPS